MITMIWYHLLNTSTGITTPILIEHIDSGIVIWGICHKDEDKDTYQPIIRTPDRKGLQTILESLPLLDAQEAVEKRLFDTGVLKEGDEIEYPE